MQRKTFLKIVGGVVAIGAIGYVAVPTFEEMLLKILRSDLKGLKVNEDTISKYLLDYKKENVYIFIYILVHLKMIIY